MPDHLYKPTYRYVMSHNWKIKEQGSTQNTIRIFLTLASVKDFVQVVKEGQGDSIRQ